MILYFQVSFKLFRKVCFANMIKNKLLINVMPFMNIVFSSYY